MPDSLKLPPLDHACWKSPKWRHDKFAELIADGCVDYDMCELVTGLARRTFWNYRNGDARHCPTQTTLYAIVLHARSVVAA